MDNTNPKSQIPNPQSQDQNANGNTPVQNNTQQTSPSTSSGNNTDSGQARMTNQQVGQQAIGTSNDSQAKNPTQGIAAQPSAVRNDDRQGQQPGSPIGSGMTGGVKEQAPVVVQGVQTSELVRPSTPEVVLPQEVQDVGVEAHSEVPKLEEEMKQIGVKAAKDATPVILSQEEAEPLSLKTPHPVIKAMMKTHKSVKEGISWLLRLINKQQDLEEQGLSKRVNELEGK